MKTFKKGDRVKVTNYVDSNFIGANGTVLVDSRSNMFEEVKLDNVEDTMYFWYTEIEKICEA